MGKSPQQALFYLYSLFLSSHCLLRIATLFCIPSLFLSSPRQNLQPYCFVTTLSCPTQTDCKHALHIDHCRRRARRRRRCPRPELPRIQQRCRRPTGPPSSRPISRPSLRLPPT